MQDLTNRAVWCAIRDAADTSVAFCATLQSARVIVPELGHDPPFRDAPAFDPLVFDPQLNVRSICPRPVLRSNRLALIRVLKLQAGTTDPNEGPQTVTGLLPPVHGGSTVLEEGPQTCGMLGRGRLHWDKIVPKLPQATV
jgi:hypothetical protein